MDNERRYTVKFENLTESKLRILNNSLKLFLYKTLKEDKYDRDYEYRVKSLEELIDIVQPVLYECDYQSQISEEYELYLKLKAKFENPKKV